MVLTCSGEPVKRQEKVAKIPWIAGKKANGTVAYIYIDTYILTYTGILLSHEK